MCRLGFCVHKTDLFVVLGDEFVISLLVVSVLVLVFGVCKIDFFD